ncbi:MAG: hypothetical protein IKK21_06580, partial [Clostridia bacterium]|nr:hypothetical protein [Clostridia bacterium]
MDAVPLTQMISHDGFLYWDQGDAVMLLCAGDPDGAGVSVEIPAEVNGKAVTAISAYVFIGCTSLKAITLPAAVKDTVTPGATADCPAAVISYVEEEPEEVIVHGVTADVTAGASGNSITWHVDAQVSEGGSYHYTVEHNGENVLTTESDEATFTYDAENPGAYRLLVTVIGRGGASATGASAMMYIAVEAMEMTLPESIRAGENLTITFDALENAQGYTIYVTNEVAGELVYRLSRTAAGTASIDGYLFEAGEYRVSGYVHGNDYRYTVPTVRNVTVAGTPAAGPAIPAHDPVMAGHLVEIRLEEKVPFAVRSQRRHADGTLTEPQITRSIVLGDNQVNVAYISTDAADVQTGDVILVQAAMLCDGAWTGWGPVTEVTLTDRLTLEAPVVTCPEKVRAGEDFTVSFTSVENATWYQLDISNDVTGEVWNVSGYNEAQTIYISGAMHALPAGTYTVKVLVYADEYDFATGTAKLTITGTRPAAPAVALDVDVFYLEDGEVTITVTAPGYEAASVGNEVVEKPEREYGFNTQQISLLNGVGSRTWNVGLGEWAKEQYLACFAFVYADGVWSEPGLVFIPIRMPEPMTPAVITAPETLQTGEDLTFSFAAVEAAESYQVLVCNAATSDGSSICWFDDPQPDTDYTCYGYKLAPGNYYVQVTALSAKQGSSTSKHYFTVSGTRPDAPAVTCDPAVAWVGGTTTFTVDAADAEDVYVDWINADGMGTVPGSGTTWRYFFHESLAGEKLNFRFSVKRDGRWSQWATIELEVLTEKPVEKPVITCPETVQAGEDFTVVYTAVEDASSYRVEIYQGYADGVTPSGTANRRLREFFDAADTCYVSGGVYDLTAGDYTVVVRASNDSVVISEASARLTVTGTRPAAPQLTLDKDVYYVTGTEIQATVTAPGYETASVSGHVLAADGSEWAGSTGRIVALGSDGSGSEAMGWGELPSTDYSIRIRASVLMGNVWSDFATVTLPVMEHETLGQTTITAPETVANGTDMVVRFAPVEHAETYDINVCTTLNGEAVYYVGPAQPDTDYTIPGYVMAAGSYRIVVCASSSEYGSSTTEAFLTVTGTRPAAPSVTCDSDAAWVGGTLGFAVDAADTQDVYAEVVTESLGSATLSGSGSAWSYTIPSWYAGETVTFRFSVKRDGVWSQWTTFEWEVLEEKPLEAPTLTCPETIKAGADLTITFGEVAGAYGYVVRICAGYTEGVILEDADWIVSRYPGVAGTFTVDGYDTYLAEGTYTVVVGVYHEKGDAFRAARLEVTASTRPAKPTVTVNKTQVLPGEKYAFTITTSGAELGRYQVRYNDGSGRSGALTLLDDVTVWESSYGQEKECTYTFCVYADGVWSEWSDPIVVSVSNTIPAPEITMPASFALGRDVVVNVGAVENAVRYRARVYNAVGREVEERLLEAAEGGNILFEGYLFAAGAYTMKVCAYNGSGWSNASETSFTMVSGERPEAPAAVADSETGSINSSFGFTVPTAGAEKAAVRYYRMGNSDYVTYTNLAVTADSLRWTDRKWDAGETWNYAFAVQVDGVWSPFCASIPVTIVARAQLAQVAINCPSTVQAGTDTVFTFDAVDNADSYSVVLECPDGSSRFWNGSPGKEMLLPGYDLSAGEYTLKITASGAACDSSMAVRTFNVTGTRTVAPEVMVDKETVFTSEKYTFAITGGDCDLIAWRYVTDGGGSNMGTLNALTDVTVWETSAYWEGVQSYSFCTLQDGVWSDWSEPVAVTITQRPAMPEPVVTLPETLQRGRDLNVTFAAVEGAEYYYVYLYTIYGQQIASRYLEEAGSIVFEGCILPENYVRVMVDAYGADGGRSEFSVLLRVQDATLPAAPEVSGPANGQVLT